MTTKIKTAEELYNTSLIGSTLRESIMYAIKEAQRDARDKTIKFMCTKFSGSHIINNIDWSDVDELKID